MKSIPRVALGLEVGRLLLSGPKTTAELGEALDLEERPTQRLMAELVEHGLPFEQTRPTHGRQAVWSTTPEALEKWLADR